MRTKALAVAIALLMLVAVVPALAFADPGRIDYSVYDVGPELRAQPVSSENIDLSSDTLSDGGGSGSTEEVDYVVGDIAYWLGLNDFTGQYVFKYYTLKAAGDSAEIWVATNLAFPAGDPRPTPVVTDEQLEYLMEQVESNILPTMTGYFREPDLHDGSAALLPTLVGLPAEYYVGDKLVVLVDNIRDSNYYDPTYPSYIAGFYSPSYEAYFDRNVISIDCYDWANRLGPEAPRPYLYEGVTAHEFQHLLHDDVDGDEETFLNEGLADFAQVVCGYGMPQSHLDAIKTHPENSLVAWGDQGDLEILADYGIAFLWAYYLYEQYGTGFIKGLFNDPLNGLDSVDDMLIASDSDRDVARVFQDFSVAMLIDSSTANYRYGFRTIAFTLDIGAPDAPNDEAFATPGAPSWGSDYVWITGSPKQFPTLAFDGDETFTRATAWTSDNGMLWSGTGDLLDNWAIFEAAGGGTLTFDTVWDLEDFWDFGFVQVSTDGGATWTSLANGYTTIVYDPNAHPKVIANLPGLTSYVTSPVTMSFDLSAYAGQDVLIGFRTVTDWATHYGGWWIDNVYVDDVLISDGTDATAFRDITEVVPVDQEFVVTLVGIKSTNKGNQYKVLTMDLNHLTEEGLFDLASVLSWSQKAVMVVGYLAGAGMTNYAEYDLSY